MHTQRDFLLHSLADYLEDLDVVLKKESVSAKDIDVLRKSFRLLRESLLAPMKIPTPLLERIRFISFPVFEDGMLSPEFSGVFRFNSIGDRNYFKNRANIKAKLINLKEAIADLQRMIIKTIPRVQQEK